MELYRKDTSCIEVLLHPLLRTLEVVDQFNGITTDFEKISKHLERQKNRKEEINVMADLLDEKLNSLLEDAPSASPRRW